MDALKRIGKIRENIVKQTKKKPTLKFNSELALIGPQTIKSWALVTSPNQFSSNELQREATRLGSRDKHPAYNYFEKAVEKNVHTTIRKGNMGYDQYNVPDTSCQTYFCCFPLALANSPWPLDPLLQISLKNSELKTTRNTFRDCRTHFLRQPFLK